MATRPCRLETQVNHDAVRDSTVAVHNFRIAVVQNSYTGEFAAHLLRTDRTQRDERTWRDVQSYKP
jgi:hypothetical protein